MTHNEGENEVHISTPLPHVQGTGMVTQIVYRREQTPTEALVISEDSMLITQAH